MSTSTLGSRLRELREELGLTQDEVSMRSVDQDGRILRRIEVGHVESGRNMASTLRVRMSLARAFNVSADQLFDYLEGRISLTDFLKLRNRARGPLPRGEAAKSAREQAIELVIADGYGTPVEVRRAASTARDSLPAAKADALGVLEWANLIESTLRRLRRGGDPAAASGVNPKASAKGSIDVTNPTKMKGQRSA